MAEEESFLSSLYLPPPVGHKKINHADLRGQTPCQTMPKKIPTTRKPLPSTETKISLPHICCFLANPPNCLLRKRLAMYFLQGFLKMLAQIAVPVALNVGRSFANVGRSNILRVTLFVTLVTFFVTSGIIGFANGSPVDH